MTDDYYRTTKDRLYVPSRLHVWFDTDSKNYEHMAKVKPELLAFCENENALNAAMECYEDFDLLCADNPFLKAVIMTRPNIYEKFRTRYNLLSFDERYYDFSLDNEWNDYEKCRQHILEYIKDDRNANPAALHTYSLEHPEVIFFIKHNEWSHLLGGFYECQAKAQSHAKRTIDPNHKPMEWWLKKENCLSVALQYAHRKDFRDKEPYGYSIASKQGWLPEICKHMPRNGSDHERGIYAFEFPDKHVYVGMTIDFTKRRREHLGGKENRSPVFRHMKKTRLEPTFVIKHEYCEKNIAAELEGVTLEEYVLKGWIPLNKAATGSMGSNNNVRHPWTEQEILEEIDKCESWKDFILEHSGAYCSASRKRILDKCRKYFDSKHVQ